MPAKKKKALPGANFLKKQRNKDAEKPHPIELIKPLKSLENESVVLLHGATGHYSDMQELEHFLVRAGYDVHNWGYPSTSMKIAECAEHIYVRDFSKEFNNAAKKIHFVGFSMGGLVTHEIIKRYQPKNLGHVITMGTPYHGSHVADFMKNKLYYKLTFGPAGQELTSDFRKAVMQNAPHLPYKLGTIAGDSTAGYLIARHLFNGVANDGRVSITSANHPDQIDHALVHANHKTLPKDKDAMLHTYNFLRYGSFTPPIIKTP